MSNTAPAILLTGATGYIGGSILTHLLDSQHLALKNVVITCLVRGEDRVAKLNAKYGSRVKPVLHKDLDDTDRAIEVASQHDIVINTTIGYHPASAAALVQGLAKRKQQTGRDVWMIHTSGTSNLADRPISKGYVEDDPERVFDDSKDDIYAYEKMRNDKELYPQRTSELGVIDEGVKLGVKTLVIMSPTIYGVGTGEFNVSSIQVPAYVNACIAKGYAMVAGDGKGVWDNVHVGDLAELYALCLVNIVEKGGADLPTGKQGTIFSENGRHTWMDIAQGVADAAYEAGRIKSRDVRSVSLQEAADAITGGDPHIVELAMSSNSRTKGTVAREKLGWKPTRGPDDFKRGFTEEVKAAIQKEAK
ncbi:hypothetical protein BAUCODRAFT_30180 [Baudoinia panamericana UAMH 10762]|uniref:Uncharacterized protein n=1 Tax=Baudoinia panamericana (strain UAMH 10762) TaxID=717646 RepID=M2LYJ1_BAUPA|nr:uncharacterized protein BAUCODRAFT_30180 [Baudoinia panamericana UAMH 10762]EMC99777.1 hypothetical protein BAUCODRAFT_30180 [Baudoinia panamericana UAMH 10762]